MWPGWADPDRPGLASMLCFVHRRMRTHSSSTRALSSCLAAQAADRAYILWGGIELSNQEVLGASADTKALQGLPNLQPESTTSLGAGHEGIRG